MTAGTPVAVTVVALDPPFAADHGVLFGPQSKTGVDDPVPAATTTEFPIDIVVRTTDEGIDFAGDHVHGRPGDRFIYIAWGLPDPTEPFVMFARAKIKLAHVPPEMIATAISDGRSLRAEFQATNAKGQPASGTIKPARVGWSLD